ncbi:alpha/beta hydrolase [Algoriphagus hitonicola]|uniref:Phospholipase/carboxylesterase n=1 Tax=Algoriphagus hitonicola TaxID=435880 RepID=A0A1I2UF07_9BACT|nr:dienelactone hydrolase family protein [Algoriphagus hitonicola]SFG74959.1 phospholipase/carboxylesterase [Algoriphagus hitonicola]
MHDVTHRGLPLDKAKKAAILIHGRGATAQSILSLSNHLRMDDFALLAPQADDNTWYPYSFMAPDQSNDKSLNDSLAKIQTVYDYLIGQGLSPDQIYFIGFSQGACISLDFAARNAQKFGGVIAFTGGLIGEKLKKENYSGDFGKTPVFIGSSERDIHVPAVRIEASADLLREMGAEVTVKFFSDPQHTIRQEEIDWVNKHILS